MNQQMHNWSTIYHTAHYYTAPICFNSSTKTHCIYGHNTILLKNSKTK